MKKLFFVFVLVFFLSFAQFGTYNGGISSGNLITGGGEEETETTETGVQPSTGGFLEYERIGISPSLSYELGDACNNCPDLSGWEESFFLARMDEAEGFFEFFLYMEKKETDENTGKWYLVRTPIQKAPILIRVKGIHESSDLYVAYTDENGIVRLNFSDVCKAWCEKNWRVFDEDGNVDSCKSACESEAGTGSVVPEPLGGKCILVQGVYCPWRDHCGLSLCYYASGLYKEFEVPENGLSGLELFPFSSLDDLNKYSCEGSHCSGEEQQPKNLLPSMEVIDCCFPEPPVLQYTLCIPLFLIFALLAGAMYLSGRNPFAGFDLNAPRHRFRIKYIPMQRAMVYRGGAGFILSKVMAVGSSAFFEIAALLRFASSKEKGKKAGKKAKKSAKGKAKPSEKPKVEATKQPEGKATTTPRRKPEPVPSSEASPEVSEASQTSGGEQKPGAKGMHMGGIARGAGEAYEFMVLRAIIGNMPILREILGGIYFSARTGAIDTGEGWWARFLGRKREEKTGAPGETERQKAQMSYFFGGGLGTFFRILFTGTLLRFYGGSVLDSIDSLLYFTTGVGLYQRIGRLTMSRDPGKFTVNINGKEYGGKEAFRDKEGNVYIDTGGVTKNGKKIFIKISKDGKVSFKRLNKATIDTLELVLLDGIVLTAEEEGKLNFSVVTKDENGNVKVISFSFDENGNIVKEEGLEKEMEGFFNDPEKAKKFWESAEDYAVKCFEAAILLGEDARSLTEDISKLENDLAKAKEEGDEKKVNELNSKIAEKEKGLANLQGKIRVFNQAGIFLVNTGAANIILMHVLDENNTITAKNGKKYEVIGSGKSHFNQNGDLIVAAKDKDGKEVLLRITVKGKKGKKKVDVAEVEAKKVEIDASALGKNYNILGWKEKDGKISVLVEVTETEEVQGQIISKKKLLTISAELKDGKLVIGEEFGEVKTRKGFYSFDINNLFLDNKGNLFSITKDEAGRIYKTYSDGTGEKYQNVAAGISAASFAALGNLIKGVEIAKKGFDTRSVDDKTNSFAFSLWLKSKGVDKDIRNNPEALQKQYEEFQKEMKDVGGSKKYLSKELGVDKKSLNDLVSVSNDLDSLEGNVRLFGKFKDMLKDDKSISFNSKTNEVSISGKKMSFGEFLAMYRYYEMTNRDPKATPKDILSMMTEDIKSGTAYKPENMNNFAPDITRASFYVQGGGAMSGRILSYSLLTHVSMSQSLAGVSFTSDFSLGNLTDVNNFNDAVLDTSKEKSTMEAIRMFSQFSMGFNALNANFFKNGTLKEMANEEIKMMFSVNHALNSLSTETYGAGFELGLSSGFLANSLKLSSLGDKLRLRLISNEEYLKSLDGVSNFIVQETNDMKGRVDKKYKDSPLESRTEAMNASGAVLYAASRAYDLRPEETTLKDNSKINFQKEYLTVAGQIVDDREKRIAVNGVADIFQAMQLRADRGNLTSDEKKNASEVISLFTGLSAHDALEIKGAQLINALGRASSDLFAYGTRNDINQIYSQVKNDIGEIKNVSEKNQEDVKLSDPNILEATYIDEKIDGHIQALNFMTFELQNSVKGRASVVYTNLVSAYNEDSSDFVDALREHSGNDGFGKRAADHLEFLEDQYRKGKISKEQYISEVENTLRTLAVAGNKDLIQNTVKDVTGKEISDEIFVIKTEGAVKNFVNAAENINQVYDQEYLSDLASYTPKEQIKAIKENRILYNILMSDDKTRGALKTLEDPNAMYKDRHEASATITDYLFGRAAALENQQKEFNERKEIYSKSAEYSSDFVDGVIKLRGIETVRFLDSEDPMAKYGKRIIDSDLELSQLYSELQKDPTNKEIEYRFEKRFKEVAESNPEFKAVYIAGNMKGDALNFIDNSPILGFYKERYKEQTGKEVNKDNLNDFLNFVTETSSTYGQLYKYHARNKFDIYNDIYQPKSEAEMNVRIYSILANQAAEEEFRKSVYSHEIDYINKKIGDSVYKQEYVNKLNPLNFVVDYTNNKEVWENHVFKDADDKVKKARDYLVDVYTGKKAYDENEVNKSQKTLKKYLASKTDALKENAVSLGIYDDILSGDTYYLMHSKSLDYNISSEGYYNPSFVIHNAAKNSIYSRISEFQGTHYIQDSIKDEISKTQKSYKVDFEDEMITNIGNRNEELQNYYRILSGEIRTYSSEMPETKKEETPKPPKPKTPKEEISKKQVRESIEREQRERAGRKLVFEDPYVTLPEKRKGKPFLGIRKMKDEELVKHYAETKKKVTELYYSNPAAKEYFNTMNNLMKIREQYGERSKEFRKASREVSKLKKEIRSPDLKKIDTAYGEYVHTIKELQNRGLYEKAKKNYKPPKVKAPKPAPPVKRGRNLVASRKGRSSKKA